MTSKTVQNLSFFLNKVHNVPLLCACGTTYLHARCIYKKKMIRGAYKAHKPNEDLMVLIFFL